jgi:hypothetical protein
MLEQTDCALVKEDEMDEHLIEYKGTEDQKDFE